jgi:hypothetical protein
MARPNDDQKKRSASDGIEEQKSARILANIAKQIAEDTRGAAKDVAGEVVRETGLGGLEGGLRSILSGVVEAIKVSNPVLFPVFALFGSISDGVKNALNMQDDIEQIQKDQLNETKSISDSIDELDGTLVNTELKEQTTLLDKILNQNNVSQLENESKEQTFLLKALLREWNENALADLERRNEENNNNAEFVGPLQPDLKDDDVDERVSGLFTDLLLAKIGSIFTTITTMFTSVADKVGNIFKAAKKFGSRIFKLTGLLTALFSIFEGFTDAAEILGIDKSEVTVLDQIKASLRAFIGNIIGGIPDLLFSLLGVDTDLSTAIKKADGDMITRELTKGINVLFNKMFETIGSVFEFFQNSDGLVDSDSLKNGLLDLGLKILEVFAAIGEPLIAIGKSLFVDIIIPKVSELIEPSLQEMFKFIFEDVPAFFTGIVDRVKSFFVVDIPDFFSQLGTQSSEILGSIKDVIVDFFLDIFEKLKSLIPDFDNISDFVTNLADDAAESASGLFDSFKETIGIGTSEKLEGRLSKEQSTNSDLSAQNSSSVVVVDNSKVVSNNTTGGGTTVVAGSSTRSSESTIQKLSEKEAFGNG